jgi:PilZ domain
MRIRFERMGRTPNLEAEQFGDLVNTNHRGLCIAVRTPLKREQVLRMFLPLIDQKTTVSTLGEVRWVKRKAIGEEGYWVGLQYLL